MKINYEADITAYMEPDGLHIFLYLHPSMNEALEFKIPYTEMVDSVVESHIYPRSGEMSPAGYEALEELVEVFSANAVSIANLISKFKGKEYVYRKDS